MGIDAPSSKDRIMEITTYKTAAENMDSINKAVAKANARLEKRGYAERVGIVEISRSFRPVDAGNPLGAKIEIVEFEIAGPPMVDGGWTFVAVIDHLGEGANVVRTLRPDLLGDEAWHDRKGICEHCGHKRQRSQTVLVHNDGETKQIGSTCLEAYTACSAAFAIVKELNRLYKLANGIEDQIGGNGGRGQWVYGVLEVVAAALVVSKEGAEYNKESIKFQTSSCLERARKPNSSDPMYPWPTNDQFAKAAEILTWADAQAPNSDYMRNVQAIIKADVVNFKHFGFITSLVPGYLKHLGVVASRANAPVKANEYFGKVGDRVELELTLVRTPGFNTAYGYMTVYTFEASNGATFVWKSTADAGMEIGEKAVVRGTIKAHDEFRGTKQTVLTRCVVNVAEKAEPEAKVDWASLTDDELFDAVAPNPRFRTPAEMREIERRHMVIMDGSDAEWARRWCEFFGFNF